jgi:hypothetical protein
LRFIIIGLYNLGVIKSVEEANLLLGMVPAVGKLDRRDVGDAQIISLLDRTIEAEPKAVETNSAKISAFYPGTAPVLPPLLIGRDYDLQVIKNQLTKKSLEKALCVLTGMLGVGKTTVASALAHDPQVLEAFPDGVLWTSLGQHPNVLGVLIGWLRAFSVTDLSMNCTESEASGRLTALLRDKKVLLIIDDVWEVEHATLFNVGGKGCASLFTTRLTNIAYGIAHTPKAIYRLDILSESHALELLQALAPTVITNYYDEALKLVKGVECLPILLQIIGRMLEVEASYGWDISELISEMGKGQKLLESKLPGHNGDSPNATLICLLQKNIKRLNPQTRDRFAKLGAFAPKPATFSLDDLAFVWQTNQPKQTARILVDRGLLEPAGDSLFRMHALLVWYAHSLLEK